MAGILCTLIPVAPRAGGFAMPSPLLIWGAGALALLAGFAMGWITRDRTGGSRGWRGWTEGNGKR